MTKIKNHLNKRELILTGIVVLGVILLLLNLFITSYDNNKQRLLLMYRRINRQTIKKTIQFAGIFMILGILYSLIGCPFRFFLGIPTPGCGMTRAWLLVAQGRFSDAFSMHPLFILAPPLVLLILSKRHKRTENIALVAIVSIFVVVYIIRMVLMFPHTEPLVFNPNAVWLQILNFFS